MLGNKIVNKAACMKSDKMPQVMSLESHQLGLSTRQKEVNLSGGSRLHDRLLHLHLQLSCWCQVALWVSGCLTGKKNGQNKGAVISVQVIEARCKRG